MKKYGKIEQGTLEWLQKRKGVITGTVLKSIMGTPKSRQEAFYEVLAQRLTLGVEEDYENPMDRGTRLEPEARAMFELEYGKTVDQVGMLEDDTNPMIGNSPDGLIGEDEAIEIKCMGGKNHVKLWLTNQIPEEYLWQVVQYFVVNEKLKKLYFVGYNPDIPTHPMHVLEMQAGDMQDEIALARKNQTEFIDEINKALEKLISL